MSLSGSDRERFGSLSFEATSEDESFCPSGRPLTRDECRAEVDRQRRQDGTESITFEMLKQLYEDWGAADMVYILGYGDVPVADV